MGNVEKNIVSNLVGLRKASNLKQSDLAEKIGYSDKTISRWENGSTIPDVVSLCVIADFYKISLDSLVKENALAKFSEKSKNKERDKKVRDLTMLGLSVITIASFFAIAYVILQIVKGFDFWPLFIWAAPIISLIVHRYNRKHKRNKIISFITLSFALWSLVAAVFFSLFPYVIWQIFFIPIPAQSAIMINTILKRTEEEEENGYFNNFF